MAAFEREILSPSSDKIKLLKWKVRKGSMVNRGSVLALYQVVTDNATATVCKLKAEEDGTVLQLVAEEGEVIQAKNVLLRVKGQADKGCTHPTIMKDMCANCGADLRIENGVAGDRKNSVSASVAIVHSIPELIVSQEHALELGKEDENGLLRQRKLVLLVDLDQTLIHTTNDQIPSNIKDVKHFQLWDGRGYMWYHTRFRPFTQQFLEAVSKMYELHICTFGVRLYAHTIARLLDPEKKFFSHRILSRDECFDSLSKTANLKALFPHGDKMVGIIDDREDVWNFAPNLIHVRPYRFFQGTADINAPPGLTKSEQDNIPIVHKTVSHKDSDDKELDSSKGDNQSSEQKEGMTAVEKVSEEAVDELDGEIKSEGKEENPEQSEKIESNEENVYSTKEKSELETKDSGDGDGILQNKDSASDSIPCDETGVNKNVDKKGELENVEIEMKEAGGVEDQKDEVTETDVSDEKGDKNKDEEIKIIDDNDEVEWEDTDDYLLHLQEILTRIHQAYYNMYDQSVKEGSSQLPDLKNIIPYVKRKVLKGTNLVFSGMFPVNMPPEKSKAYVTAKSLGANIQADLVPDNKYKKSSSPPDDATTHLIAAKAGTAKFKSALKTRGVNVVSGDWLWACAERWEWVTEELFFMGKTESSYGMENKGKKGGKRKKTADDGALDDDGQDSDSGKGSPSRKKKVDSKKIRKKDGKGKGKGEFANSYNPLLSFSNEDIEFMDKEVDEMMAEDDDDSDESDQEREQRIRRSVLTSSADSESDSDSLAGDFPRGWKMRRKSLSPQHKASSFEDLAKTDQDDDEETENELERYQKTVDTFANQNSDQDSESSGESIGSVDEELAAAVEKEFLGSL